MFAYKSIECFHQLLKKQTSDCCSISLNPYMVFQTEYKNSIKDSAKILTFVI